MSMPQVVAEDIELDVTILQGMQAAEEHLCLQAVAGNVIAAPHYQGS